MNMLHAETANWYDYVPGLFPDNVKSVIGNQPDVEVTFTFNKSYDPTWMTYNEFSQITPFPTAWDITAAGAAPGSGGCSTGTYGAVLDRCGVHEGLQLPVRPGERPRPATRSSPIWAIVDGPYTIAASKGGSFSTLRPGDDGAEHAPTAGPRRPRSRCRSCRSRPTTPSSTPWSAATSTSGTSPSRTSRRTRRTRPIAGPNNPRLTNFYLTPWVLYGFNYAVLKFESTGDNGNAGAIYKQLYFRQAMQSMVDQPAMISKFLKGYGVPTYGPVPVLPKNDLVDSYEQSNPYPYNPSHAKSLLTSHGWKVVPNGIDTCQKRRHRPERVRRRHPQGCAAQLHHGLRQRHAVAAAGDARSSSRPGTSIGIKTPLVGNTFPTVIQDYAAPCHDRVALHGRRRLVGRRLGVQPGLLPLG